jgi:hypothetical protein
LGQPLMGLLTNGNSDLRRDGIWTWSIPAWVTTLDDGRTVNCCPSAGECAKPCYARKGTYNFRNVKAKHQANLKMLLDDLDGWTAQMIEEVGKPKFKGKFVRIHDGGDFFTREYLEAWLKVIRSAPETTFYCYTKEVKLFKEIVEPDPPLNFKWVFSFGGRQDHFVEEHDRQCDVFPTSEALESAGFFDQEASDLLAITGPLKVGIVINNHPGAVKGLKGQSFRELQAARHSKAQ